MKKSFSIVVLLILFQIGLTANTNDYSSDKYFSFSWYWTSTHYVTPEKVYECNVEEEYYQIFDRSSVRLDENGYFYFKNTIFIPGIFYTHFDLEKGWYKKFHSDSGSYVGSYLGTKYDASSYLTEKNKGSIIKYTPDNLGKFAFNSEDKYSDIKLIDDAIPWVEGVKGYGIGEYITISTDKPFSSLAILNGYVDLEKLDLYKKNSRVKIFKAIDLDNDIVYEFNLEDIVEIQKFFLVQETCNLKLIIVDVYKGSLWDDTCVTGIVTGKASQPKVENFQKQTYTMFKTEKEINKSIDWFTTKFD